jgi:ribosomal-protein-alanine acetyltransferase
MSLVPVQLFSVFQINNKHINIIVKIQDDCDLSKWTRVDYSNQIKKKNSINLVIMADKKVVGFLIASLIRIGKETPQIENETNNNNSSDVKTVNFKKKTKFNEAEVYNIAIINEYQHKGAGSLLLERFVDKCKNLGVEAIWLEVRESNNTAINFYKKFNFKEIQIRKYYYTNPPENALIMKLNVEKLPRI